MNVVDKNRFQQMLENRLNFRQNEDPNEILKTSKEWITDAVRESGTNQFKKKKHWMTDKTLQRRGGTSKMA